jgi:hypothetical protein
MGAQTATDLVVAKLDKAKALGPRHTLAVHAVLAAHDLGLLQIVSRWASFGVRDKQHTKLEERGEQRHACVTGAAFLRPAEPASFFSSWSDSVKGRLCIESRVCVGELGGSQQRHVIFAPCL